MHAFWLPKQQCNQPQPPQPPHWSTRPTGPVDHPADPPTHRAPHPHPTLALGLRTLGAPGPPQGPLFSVFVLPCSLTASDTPGRPLTERSKTLGPRATNHIPAPSAKLLSATATRRTAQNHTDQHSPGQLALGVGAWGVQLQIRALAPVATTNPTQDNVYCISPHTSLLRRSILCRLG